MLYHSEANEEATLIQEFLNRSLMWTLKSKKVLLIMNKTLKSQNVLLSKHQRVRQCFCLLSGWFRTINLRLET